MRTYLNGPIIAGFVACVVAALLGAISPTVPFGATLAAIGGILWVVGVILLVMGLVILIFELANSR